VSGTTRIAKDGEYAKQRVSVSLDFFLGEWFLDTKQGMPYFRDVLVKNPNSDTVRSVFKRRILQTPGIVSVDRSRSRSTRRRARRNDRLRSDLQGRDDDPQTD
jgi:hypothetical protein